ncbi:hypothetical protein KUV62_10675 [Salipiger bermudensis]|uniref:hypothetical protein n=1 Tax=Salipiger bermudensis TaxID=344736 RepID=UPI001C99BB41|nr:hypothetical protein [Salipiger bermudensis]MBY6004375.1 hypothetical protein [Salipiger bermudensis]
MHHESLAQFLRGAKTALGDGPVAMVFCEDEVEIDTTLRHVLQSGFRCVIAFMPKPFAMARDLRERVHRVDYDLDAERAVPRAVDAVIGAGPGLWMFYCFNAEYLFYPYCETRSVSEMLAFHAEERRDAMLTYVIDLYAGDLKRFPDAVSLDRAYLDRSGYYAQARSDAARRGHPKERQLDFYGGLRWRYEEHVPEARRKIDRIALFRAKPGLTLRDDHSFSDEEYNTYACPWHNNLTAALVSFRTAKALKRNPGSSYDIRDFRWHNSTEFEWHSRQLLDLGLMEPGQWF